MTEIQFPDGRTPLLVSSHASDLIAAEAQALVDYLVTSEVSVDAVAAETLRRRAPRRHQALVLADDSETAQRALSAGANGKSDHGWFASDAPAVERRIALVFPGQGSQRPGMGRGYYEASTEFRAAVDACNAIFVELYDFSPLDYLLDSDAANDIAVVQPALFLQTIGLTAMWRATGIEIAATVGHSQGEIPAAAAAGLISLRDAVRVVTTRARLVARVEQDGIIKGPFAMAVIGLDRDGTEAAIARCSGWAELAVVNSPNIHAISGDLDAVTDIVESLTETGVFAKQIRVDYPAHTSLLREFKSEFTTGLLDDLDSSGFIDGEIACYGGTLGAELDTSVRQGEYWYWNLRNRVRFDKAVAAAAADGITTFVEISDHPTMLLAMGDILRGEQGVRVVGTGRRGEAELREFSTNLARVVVGDSGYDWRAQVRDRTGPTLFGLPGTQFQRKVLWASNTSPRRAAESIAAGPAAEPTYVPQLLAEQWRGLDSRQLHAPRRVAVVAPGALGEGLRNAFPAALARMGATAVEPADADVTIVIAPDASVISDVSFLPERGEVVLLTGRGERVVDGDDELDMAQSAFAAGFRCLAADYPTIRFRHLDVGVRLDDPTEAGMIARYALEAAHTVDGIELAVRGRDFYVKRLSPLSSELPASSPGGVADLDHVVVLGGTGAIGLDVCEHVARRGARTVTLVSRSGGDKAAAQRIAAVNAGGDVTVEVWRGDVTEPDVMAELAAHVGSAGPSLVVHATVDYAAAEAAASDPRAFEAAAAAKIGVVELAERILHGPSTRVLMCSSLSATVGGRGHRAYAALNRMLDATAIRMRANGTAATSVQWGLWRSVGAENREAVDVITASGLLPMDPTSALDAALEFSRNRVIVAADWHRLQQILALGGAADLLAEVPLVTSDVVAPTTTGVVESVASMVEVPAIERSADVASTPDTSDVPGHIRTVLADIMGMGTADDVDPTVPLVSLGLDSVQALDLRQRLEADLRTEIPITAMLSGASLDDVVSLIDA